MNIVKGVADLLRRSSGGQAGEGVSWTLAEKHSAPSPRIRFSETSEEAILNSLWQRYENTIDKVEKRTSLQVFLLHFIQTYKNWEPENNGELLAALPSTDDIILGCSSGHPSEVILILVQEIARLTSLVSELNNNASNAKSDTSDPSSSLTLSADGLYVLNSLMIANRSMDNCKVFSYYGGVQKVTALLKERFDEDEGGFYLAYDEDRSWLYKFSFINPAQMTESLDLDLDRGFQSTAR